MISRQSNALAALQQYESDSEEETIKPQKVPPKVSSKIPRNNSVKWLGFVSMFVFLLACADTKYTLSESAIKIGKKGVPIFNKELEKEQCLNIIRAFASELKKYKPTESPHAIQPISGLSIVPSGDVVITLPDNDSSKMVLQPQELNELLNKDDVEIASSLMYEFKDACKNPIYIEWGGNTLTFEQMVILVSENNKLSKEFVRDILIVWKYFIEIKTKLVGLIDNIQLDTVVDLFTKLPEDINETCQKLFTDIHSEYHKNFSIFLHEIVAFIFTDIYHSIGAYVFLFLLCPLLGQYFINYIIKCIVLIFQRNKKNKLTPEQFLEIEKASHMFIEDLKTGGGKYILNDELVDTIMEEMKQAPKECSVDISKFLKSLPASIIYDTPTIKAKGGSKRTKAKRRKTKNNKSKKN